MAKNSKNIFLFFSRPSASFSYIITIYIDQISKNRFLGRFGTVRPKFWALTFFSGLFVKPAVKHNETELEYAKSAKSNVVNLRKLRKILFLGQFGPIWAYLVHFGAKTFFFRKSENVTFLDLLKANLSQKIRKN